MKEENLKIGMKVKCLKSLMKGISPKEGKIYKVISYNTDNLKVVRVKKNDKTFYTHLEHIKPVKSKIRRL